MTDTQALFDPWNDYFDHVLVLTLKRAKDRQAHIEKCLRGLNWHFFHGIDKNHLDYAKLLADGIYDDALHRQTKRTSRSMTLGEIACALSHLNLYRDMLDKGYQKVVILEDDVLPQPENLAKFPGVLAELPENWEVLMLGYYAHKPPIFKYRMQQKIYMLYHHLRLFNWHKVRKSWIEQICMSPVSDHIDRFGKVLGAHAYALTAEAARKFIDYQTPVKLQADRIFNYYQAEFGLEGYAVRPTMFTLSELSQQSFIK